VSMGVIPSTAFGSLEGVLDVSDAGSNPQM